MSRGSIKSPAQQILGKDYSLKGIPKEMGRQGSGDSKDSKHDHAISEQSDNRTKIR